ncbi:MAG TPA: hypothetical protein VEB20_12485 [Azospirillaceae bacterium]|nr:hypothetical protein [Azospirillaceae bacterium]
MTKRRWGLGIWFRIVLIPASLLPVLLMVFGGDRPSDYRPVRPPEGDPVVFVQPKDDVPPPLRSLEEVRLPPPAPLDPDQVLPPLPRIGT